MSVYLDSDIHEIATRLGDDAKRLEGSRVLITGGHGFLGRYLVALLIHLNDGLLAKPCRVIVMDNHITSVAQAPPPKDLVGGYRFIEHDVIRPIQIDEPLDYVIHAAGIASPQYYRRFPLETLEVSTSGTKNLLTLGRGHPLKGFLFFSSSEIYGDPDPRYVPIPESYRGNVSCLGPRACYDESKRVGETLCAVFHQVYGLPARMVRPFNVYGPGMQETDYRVVANFASRILSGQPVQVYGSGTQTRTFCYVTDAIVGFLKVLVKGRPGEPYNIGNPTPEISMLGLAKTFEQVLGRTLEIELVKHPDYYPADEPQRRCPDISKATSELGYTPAVDLHEGLKRFMGWATQHYTGGRTS